ncbi:MAG TPA: aquaporin [Candidatus Saccharibacteria bacterium]|nr:aquaporin [Candidatus Saccharibacteria bacterium]HRQ06603.1 aquaporin [Candidatus Saccharibacteria bacterium]
MATKKASSPARKATAKKSTAAKSKSKTVSAAASKNKQVVLFGVKFNKSPFLGAILAEFVGTFLLIASILTVQGQPLFVAFAIIGIAMIIGGFSGAHFNPALTVAAWVTRRINWVRAVGYIVAQAVGAAVAFLTLNAFLQNSATDATSLYASSPTLFHAATLPGGHEWYVLFAELLGTTILGFGFAAALRSVRDKVVMGFTYGLSLLVALLVAGSVTALLLTTANTGLTFVNPAAALAANGLAWELWPILVYAIAPVVGAIIGFVIHDLIQVETDGASDRR